MTVAPPNDRITVIRNTHPKRPTWELRELAIMLVTAILFIYFLIETCLPDAACSEEMFTWFGF